MHETAAVAPWMPVPNCWPAFLIVSRRDRRGSRLRCPHERGSHTVPPVSRLIVWPFRSSLMFGADQDPSPGQSRVAVKGRALQ